MRQDTSGVDQERYKLESKQRFPISGAANIKVDMVMMLTWLYSSHGELTCPVKWQKPME